MFPLGPPILDLLFAYCRCSYLFEFRTAWSVWLREHIEQTDSALVNGKPFPRLIDVTVDDLIIGLESGQFTSVDLVKVRHLRQYSNGFSV